MLLKHISKKQRYKLTPKNKTKEKKIDHSIKIISVFSSPKLYIYIYIFIYIYIYIFVFRWEGDSVDTESTMYSAYEVITQPKTWSLSTLSKHRYVCSINNV